MCFQRQKTFCFESRVFTLGISIGEGVSEGSSYGNG